MSTTQNIVAAVFLAVLAAGTFIAVQRYESPVAEIRAVDLDTEGLEVLWRWGHGACYGTCAEYTVYLNGNGDLRFIGEKYTEINGSVTSNVSDEQLFLIGSAIRYARFLERPTPIECVGIPTHPRSLTVWVKWNDEENRVVRDPDCIEAQPYEVTELVNTIEDIAKPDRWIGNTEFDYDGTPIQQ